MEVESQFILKLIWETLLNVSMKKSNLKLLKQLLGKFGKEAAMDKLQEECQELSLALHQLNHCVTKTDKKKRENDVYKELADVKNAIRTVEFFLSKSKINRYQNKKLKQKAIKHLGYGQSAVNKRQKKVSK